jgi:heat shock protein 1/8
VQINPDEAVAAGAAI